MSLREACLCEVKVLCVKIVYYYISFTFVKIIRGTELRNFVLELFSVTYFLNVGTIC